MDSKEYFGVGRNSSIMTITEEQLKQQMQLYGDLRYQIENMEANRKTVFNKILEKYPEARREIEDAEEELGSSIELAKKTEKSMKSNLDKLIEEYSKTIVLKGKTVLRTELVTVTLFPGKVTYDPKIMDGYVLNHREIAHARNEEPPTSRTTLNK